MRLAQCKPCTTTVLRYHPLQSMSLAFDRKSHSRNLTLQEPHRPVETFRAQFVVPKRAHEFADKDVDLLRDFQGAHVAIQQLHLLVAPLAAVALLEAAYYPYQRALAGPFPRSTYVTYAFGFFSTA